jgi:hypothetical protein
MIKMTFAGALCAFGLAVVACGGGSSEDSEDDGNSDECSSDSDCKGDRVCSDGDCVDPPSPNGGNGAGGSGAGTPNGGNGGNGAGGNGGGGGSPPVCADAGDSCVNVECCDDAICVDYGGTLGTACGDPCTTGTDCNSGCCASLPNGQGVCAPDEYCGIPAYCEGPGNCLSDTCVGWCTDYCSSDSQCPGDTWCVLNGADYQICFPGCDTNSDCTYLPGTSCQYVTTVNGYGQYVCAG